MGQLSASVSSLRDTESGISWRAQLRGGAGTDGGAAGNQDCGADRGQDHRAAGGQDGGASRGQDGGIRGPPPPPDPPPSNHGGAGRRRMSRQQSQNKELEFTKPMKIKEPKQFEGKPGDDFDTWWILVHVYIEDQPEIFPMDERTMDWIGSLMDKYAAAWHIQWLKGTLNGTHPKSMMGYVNALKLRFKDRDAKDEVYSDQDQVGYEGCIRDMFTKIQRYNDKALVSGAAFKKLILE